MKIFNKIRSLFKNITPRYHLSLDSRYYDAKKEQMIYVFKLFGDHTFIKLTFQDILKKKEIFYDITPLDLVDITREHYSDEDNKYKYYIDECMRGNKFKLKNSQGEKIYSGDMICNTPSLIDKIHSKDVYRVAYQTGFIHGKDFVKSVSDYSDENKKNNIMKLRVIRDQEEP